MFNFDLSQAVMIEISGERGTVIGRAEYANSENTYFIRYKNAEGLAVESWWSESALVAVED